MTNLTITVDEDTLRRARIRALEEGSSVNSLMREFLERYANEGERTRHDRAVLARLLEHARQGAGDSGGRPWTREELYGERVQWPR